MSIFITGSCGFIGYHTALTLLREGFEVIGIDHLLDPDQKLKETRLSHLSTFPAFRFMKCDLADHEKLQKALHLRKIDMIFHFSGQGRGEGENHVFSYLYHNVTGALNFLEIVKTLNISAFVLPKMGLEQDYSFYEASILARESFLRSYREKYKINIFSIDLDHVFGSYAHGRGDIPEFIHQIINEDVIYLKKKGQETRTYVYVDEIMEKIVSFVQKPQDFSKNEGYTLSQLELIQHLEDILKKDAQIIWGKEKFNSRNSPTYDITKEREEEFKKNLTSLVQNFI